MCNVDLIAKIQTTFSSPGVVHETLTLHRAHSLFFTGLPSSVDSWFPGLVAMVTRILLLGFQPMECF